MKCFKNTLSTSPFLSLFSMLILLTNTCAAQDNKNNQLKKEITEITWIHSHEDDEGNIKSYRPQSYPFPPSRGREGFRLEEDGTFIFYGIAPTDGTQTHKGKWEMEDRVIKVKFEESKGNVSFGPLNVVSLEGNLLKTKEGDKDK